MDQHEDDGFRDLIHKIEKDIGFFGVQYKDKCLKRRFNTRMRRFNMGEDYRAYIKLLEENPSEYEILLKNLTINVTNFFRNWSTFEYMRDQVLPHIFSAKRTGQSIRLWSAGCASGEEPYSLAILAMEVSKKLKMDYRFTVIGTDIDEDSLKNARIGEYDAAALNETPGDLKQNYFSPTPTGFRVNDDVKSYVQFRKEDLFGDKYPRFIDLICCRNVIIYFSREAQQILYAKFHNALVSDGYLILGKTETMMGEKVKLFERVNNRERVYSKK